MTKSVKFEIKETAVEQQLKTTPKQSLKKWLKGSLIGVLSLLCISGSVLIYVMHHHSETGYTDTYSPYMSTREDGQSIAVESIEAEMSSKETSDQNPSTSTKAPLPTRMVSQTSHLPDSIQEDTLSQEKENFQDLKEISQTSEESAPLTDDSVNDKESDTAIVPVSSTVLVHNSEKVHTQESSVVIQPNMQERTQKDKEFQAIPKGNIKKVTSKPQEVAQNTVSTISSLSQEDSEERVTFGLQQALTLRDHLKQVTSCHDDYQILLKSRIPGDSWNQLVEGLTPICVNNDSFFKELKNVFKRNQRSAMVAYYQMNNPTWLAYLKTIGSALVEIRELNPETRSPKDTLSLARTKLDQKNISETVSLIQTLPAQMQSRFNAFLNQAARYKKAQEDLDQLILLFEKKGK